MIPAFTNEGILPAGEHDTTLDDFRSRFVYNSVRAKIYAGFLVLINDLRDINCQVIYVDGSFVTDKEEPGDVDVCWSENANVDWDYIDSHHPIILDMDYPRNRQQHRYCADVFPAELTEGSSGYLFKDFFQFDKATNKPKGIIKINISI
ncbi:DUF6932 family protein [Mucilaginibacter sp. AW1-7]|uniref:DUF6932 family protein n=1 Tax=Mucilaginibacter sp. AW1-7 TaxID=3349874 RepID=UPI003F73C327